MKIAAIIAEYNPFHNGHYYQLQKAKQITDADYMIVVMSGNFTQRGTPLINTAAPEWPSWVEPI